MHWAIEMTIVAGVFSLQMKTFISHISVVCYKQLHTVIQHKLYEITRQALQREIIWKTLKY